MNDEIRKLLKDPRITHAHRIECRKCGKVISQCRCRLRGETTYDICEDCKDDPERS